MILDVTSLAIAGERDKGRTIALGREASAFGRESAFLIPGIPEGPWTHWKVKTALFESEETQNQTF